MIITSKKGMKWYKKLKIKKTFSLKNFFFNKIKEVKGSRENILTLNNVKYLSNRYSMKTTMSKDLVILKK